MIRWGTYFLHIITPLFATVSFGHLYANALRGAGRSTIAMVAMLGGFVVSRQIYLFVIKRVCNTQAAVGLGYPFGWIMCSLFMFLAYRSSPLFKTQDIPVKEE